MSNEHPDEPNAPGLVQLVGRTIRRLRDDRGHSLSELSRQAGVSKSTLSLLEAGTGNPNVETLVRIAGALGVPFSELITTDRQAVSVVRAGEGPVLITSDDAVRARLVLRATHTGVTELYEAQLTPGATYHADPHLVGCVETVMALRGQVRVGPDGDEVALRPGDAATFAGDQPHTYQALEGPATALFLLGYR